MDLTGPAMRVRIYIGENDKYNGMPLYHAIVLKARELGMAGVTVVRGIEGFGANSRIHTARILVLSSDLPIVIDIVDRADRIEKLIPFLNETVKEGLVTIENVEVLKYVNNKEI
ncbi:hypothetical protein AN618_15370 [Fervidicola ferrireducens]|uniref:Uncharacterized protein n=2 Tax=Fervidicola ferrireducens TaxID=520764 RepID=A0A140L7W9_9FIRM|nr:hypothetical protein AN618_15370 [Fervidicola ferrireducens]